MWKTYQIFILLLLFSFSAFAQKNGRIPQEERRIERLDLSINRINYLHQLYPDLDGSGRIVSLKEFRFDSTDIDLLGKKWDSPSATAFVSIHSTNMATIIGGLGNSFQTGKGVAPGVWLSSTSFLNLFPEPATYYEASRISVQNNSYGLGIENFYGAEARAYDSLVYELPYLVEVFFSGNIGDSTSLTGPYATIPDFANLSGTFKQAKNVLTIGAVNSDLEMETRSSRGPAYDGRIKPELVAFGEDGTSGAAAITSGVSVILQQAFAEKNNGALPSAALVRSTLISTADDLLTPGPDFISGYGNINARKAVALLEADQYWQDSISHQDTLVYSILLPERVNQLKVTLAWTDPPAERLAENSLVNDLNLWVESEGDLYRPLVLNPNPNVDSLLLAAKPGIDRLNVQEQVVLSGPAAGNYLFKIANEGQRQDFALSYWIDSEQDFIFTRPAPEEILTTENAEPIRWDASDEWPTGHLSYKYADESTWTEIAPTLAIDSASYIWNTPQVPGAVQLRMVVADTVFTSDTFYISPVLEPEIGFDCEESILLEWPSAASISAYQVHQLTGDRMAPLATTSDTFFVAPSDLDNAVFAVAPVLPFGKIGLRSLAIQRKSIRQSCYIIGLFTSLLSNTATLELRLSTLFDIKSVGLEKWDGNNFALIHHWPVDSKILQYSDTNLNKGENIYRAVLELNDGSLLYSSLQTVFYVPLNEVLVFPNPVFTGEIIEIVLPNFEGRTIKIYDSWGRLVEEYDLLNQFESIETYNRSAGIYFYQIVDAEGNKEYEGKVIIN